MNLSVVVVNWNSSKYLLQLMASFQELAGRLDRIVIVDNASSDFPDSIQNQYQNLVVERLDSNVGFAAAANRGIGLSNSQFVMLVNPDIQLNGLALDRLLAAVSEDPQTAIGCAELTGPDGKSQTRFQIRRLPAAFSVLSDALFLDEVKSFFFGNPGVEWNRNPFEEDSGIEVEQPAAAFWLLRKEAWESVGGFDEKFYPAWWEDVDFCKRLIDQGWKIRLFPGFKVKHHGGVSLEKLEYSEFIRIYYNNLLLYWRKHHRRSYPFIWCPVKVGLILRLVFSGKK